MALPLEILDQIVNYVEAPIYGDDRYTAHPRQIYDEAAKWRLSTLRLVCKSFCRSASVPFFRHVRITLSARHSRFASCHWPPKRLLDLSRSEWAWEVRELDVDMGRSGGHVDLEYFVEDMVAVMGICLNGLRRLGVLRLRGPLVDGDKMSEKVKEGVRTLAMDLLRFVPVPTLKELAISLPTTYDFSHIARRALTSDDTPLRIPLHVAMKGIKRLDLAFCDNLTDRSMSTSALATRYPVQECTSSRASLPPPPNHAYAAAFFQFAQLPAQLDTLRISCANLLDMDHFDIKTLTQLTSLDLRSVKVSSLRLVTIIQSCASTLQGLTLESVELKSGTWRDIFSVLCKLDNLVVFHVMDGCGYAVDGISAQWIPRRPRRVRYDKQQRILDTKELLTTFWNDEPALGVLQRRISATRAERGMAEIGEDVYRYLGHAAPMPG